jgi:acetylornithine/N-succinyldiaminopimelate aminotransferase
MSSRLMNTVSFRNVTFTSGAGAELWSDDGRAYLDFFCDVGTASLGYRSPEATNVLSELVDRSIPVHAPNIFPFQARSEAAEALCDAADMDKVFFCNSGTEAVEAAIKLARLYQFNRATSLGPSASAIPVRHTVYSYKGGFHGRTYAAMAAGDGPPYHSRGFAPLPQGFQHFNLLNEIPYTAAAVILAPVFGNNDVWEYPDGWLKELADFCRYQGIVLIFDEVQSGSGRSGGKGITYAQRINVRPDIVTMAKGLAMGAPVGAMLARGAIADTFTPGTHFSTFGGGPLGAMMVTEMVEWLKKHPTAADRLGFWLRDGLSRYSWAKNVRGPGALIAFDVDVDTMKLGDACLREGLLVGAFRSAPGAVKLTPPLNISRAWVDEGLVRLDRAYRSVAS